MHISSFLALHMQWKIETTNRRTVNIMAKTKTNDKKINNDLQTTTETNDPATRTPLKPHVTPLFLLL